MRRAAQIGMALLAGLLATAAPVLAASYQTLILTRNYKAAAALLEKSAKTGKPLAQYRIGVFYRSGLGVARDETLARGWLEKAAQGGNSDAALLLQRLSQVTTSDSKRDGIAPSGAAGPRLPIGTAAHLPVPAAGAPGWLALATARQIAFPPELYAATSVNEADAAGVTPLALAVRFDRMDEAKRLLAAGANPGLPDKRQLSAIGWAGRNGNRPMLALLAPDGHAADKTAVLQAAAFCQTDLVDDLASDTMTFAPHDIPAAARACANWPELAKKLGVTPDLNAAGHSPLHLAALAGDAGAIAVLVNAKANVDEVTPDGNTALMLAAAKGCLACVQRLEPYAADLNQKNLLGETALYMAVKAGSADVVQELVGAGASPSSRTEAKDTPLKLAGRMKNARVLKMIE